MNYKVKLKSNDDSCWCEVEADSAKSAEQLGNELRAGYVVVSVKEVTE